MFFLDMSLPAKEENGKKLLALAKIGKLHEATGIYGSEFPYGSTGVISLGEGRFYFSKPSSDLGVWSTEIALYSFDGNGNFSER